MRDYRFANPDIEYPITIQAGALAVVKIVAVAGKHDDWAAYLAPAHWHLERIAAWGTRLDQATAEALFYDMAHSGRTWRR